MSQTYEQILSHPIFQTSKVAYFSCRAPNVDCFMLARAKDDQLEQKIAQLHQREQEMLDELGFGQRDCNLSAECVGKRDCPWMSFLPDLERIEDASDYSYRLSYKCVNFGAMVKVGDLMTDYYIDCLSAYRLTASLLTLINWLIRMKVTISLSPRNLLVDLNSSFFQPISWSRAKTTAYLSMSVVIGYYRQMARMIMRLTGVQKAEEGGWILPNNADAHDFSILFVILDELSAQRYELPEKLDQANDYATKIHNLQQRILERLNQSLRYVEVRPNSPLYVVRRKK